MNDASGAVIERDLLTVGAGPVGLSGGYHAGFRELSTVIVDSLPAVDNAAVLMRPYEQPFPGHSTDVAQLAR